MVPGQLALKRARVIDFLYKVGLAHLDLVENFKTDALSYQTTLAGDFDPHVIDHLPWNQDGGAVVSELIGHLVGLERLDHMARVFRPQVGIQNAVLRPSHPDGKSDDRGQQNHSAGGNGHALNNAHFEPDSLDGVHKLRNESRHGRFPQSVSFRQKAGVCEEGKQLPCQSMTI